MSGRYTRGMDKSFRLLIVAALLCAALAACGNKGPLVKPVPAGAEPAPATIESPPSSDPTDSEAPVEIPPPPAADPATTPTPVPADGGGNG